MIMRFYPIKATASILFLEKSITTNDTEILRLQGLIRAIKQFFLIIVQMSLAKIDKELCNKQ